MRQDDAPCSDCAKRGAEELLLLRHGLSTELLRHLTFDCFESRAHLQDEHWGKDRESARTAAIVKAGPERVPNDKVEVLMPKPFHNPSQQTIPQVRLVSWPGHCVLCAVPPSPLEATALSRQ